MKKKQDYMEMFKKMELGALMKRWLTQIMLNRSKIKYQTKGFKKNT